MSLIEVCKVMAHFFCGEGEDLIMTSKLDGVDLVDNRPSTDYINQLIKKN